MTVLEKILGKRKISSVDDIEDFLIEMDSTIDFSNIGHLLLYENEDIKAWIISSKDQIFIVKDDGKLRCIFRRNKKDIINNYSIVKDDNKPKLFINNTKTCLPMNTPGGVDIFKNSFDNLLKSE